MSRSMEDEHLQLNTPVYSTSGAFKNTTQIILCD